MITDRLFHNGAHIAAQLQSVFAPTYFYYFRFITKTGIVPELNKNGAADSEPLNDFLGISHGDDIFIVFYNPDSRDQIPYSDAEKRVGHQLINLYFNFATTNFAVYGNRTIVPVEPSKLKCMEIFSPQNFSMAEKDDDFGHIKFWDSLMIRE